MAMMEKPEQAQVSKVEFSSSITNTTCGCVKVIMTRHRPDRSDATIGVANFEEN
jgi:hypothetical protein